MVGLTSLERPDDRPARGVVEQARGHSLDRPRQIGERTPNLPWRPADEPLRVPRTTRIGAPGGVAGWQLALGIALLVLTIPLLLAAVAGLFRAQILLGSAIPSRAQIVAALRGRAA